MHKLIQALDDTTIPTTELQSIQVHSSMEEYHAVSAIRQRFGQTPRINIIDLEGMTKDEEQNMHEDKILEQALQHLDKAYTLLTSLPNKDYSKRITFKTVEQKIRFIVLAIQKRTSLTALKMNLPIRHTDSLTPLHERIER